MEFSTKAAARRKPPCCGVWMSLQQLFLPQFLYAAGFVGKPDLRALPEPRLRHPLPVPDQGAAQGACYSPLPGGAGQDCRSLPGADGAVRANLKKGRSAGHLPKAAGYLGREKIAGPLHAGPAGKFVKKRGAFPLVRESAFPWCGMLGTKKSPQGVTTHESL